VIDGRDASPRAGMTVVIANGRIESVEPTTHRKWPGDVRVLKLPGRFVIPGLIDMHAHLLLSPRDKDGALISPPDEATTSQLLRALLSFGVTTVRDPGAPTQAAVQLRSDVASGRIPGPAIYTAGRILNSEAPGPEFVVVRTEREVCDEIRSQAKAGVNLVKVYSELGASLVKAAIECAHAERLPIVGHLQSTTWTEAAEMGIDGIEHAAPWSNAYLPPEKRSGHKPTLLGRVYWLANLDLSSEPVKQMVAALVRNRVALDPTLVSLHSKFWGNDVRYTQSQEISFVPAQYASGWPKGSFTLSWSEADYRKAQEQWPKVLALTRLMHAGGVRLVAGTDCPTPWLVPGVSLHQELQLLHSAGIPSAEVIRIATHNAAVAMGRESEIGSIAPGMRADLVILTRNPTADISNTRSIEYVIKEGRIYAPEELRHPR